MSDDHAMNPEAQTCPRCGGPVTCGLAGGEETCWCMAMPAVMTVPDAGGTASCYCADCLREMTAHPDTPPPPAEENAGDGGD